MLVDLKALLLAPDSAETRAPAGRHMQLGPFACGATVDCPDAMRAMTGHAPVSSHLHVALRAPDRTGGWLATAGPGVMTVFAGTAGIIHATLSI